MKILLLYVDSLNTSLLSYNEDWYDAFKKNKTLDVDCCNLASKKWLSLIPKIRLYNLIVFLHSTNSNGIKIHPWLIKSLNYRRGKVIFFVGNEYKLIPEKISLLKSLSAEYIVSQLPQNTADWLYEDIKFSRVISLAHALNPEVFKPITDSSNRELDIGVRAYEYPWYLGDRERIHIFNKFKNLPKETFKTDINLNKSKRFGRSKWNLFLNSCRGTVSTEAGTAYLEKDDRTRNSVNTYLEKYPQTSFEEIFELFFQNYKNPMSGKCITPRHFDAIGTKTCQIMFPGRFNDILQPDVHYMSLNRDFSNLDLVLERFEDVSYREKMVNETYEYVMDSHTHKHRIKKLLDLI